MTSSTMEYTREIELPKQQKEREVVEGMQTSEDVDYGHQVTRYWSAAEEKKVVRK